LWFARLVVAAGADGEFAEELAGEGVFRRAFATNPDIPLWPGYALGQMA